MAHKPAPRYQPPSRRSQPPDNESLELRDPAEGQPPAVIGQDVEAWMGDPQESAAAQPQAPTIGVKGEPIADGERDPGTIAEEQRMRSEDMQAEGVFAWMAARDSRTDEEIAASQFVADEERPRGTVIARGGGPSQERLENRSAR